MCRKTPDDRSHLRIVSVGALEERKGFDTLLDAVEILQHSGLRVQLRIIRTGALREAPWTRLSDLGLNPVETLLGARFRGDTASIIGASHLYVCSRRHETFGIVPAEALSVGRPVVSTRCGGPESYIDDASGAVVDTCDAIALAAAIEHTWRRIDSFVPERMHAEITARFGPDAFRRAMLSLYEEVRSARVAA